jgi:WD40 repeat protein
VPPALRGVLIDEARHLDLRWARDETDLDLRNSRFRAAIADLAAPMHGIAKDELEGEDIRQHRRARRLARGGVATLVVLLVVALIATGVAVNKSKQANRERNQADRSAAESLTRGLATETANLLQRKRLDEALLVAAQAEQTATRDGIGGDAGQLASTALLQTLTASPSVAGFLNDQPSTATSMDYSPDGTFFVSMTDAGEIRAWNAKDYQELPPPRVHGEGGDSTANVAVNSAGILAAPSSTNGVALWDLKQNRPFGWQPPAPAKVAGGVGGTVAARVAVSDRGLVAEAYGADPTTLDVWDLAHRRRVGTQLTFPGLPHGIAFSPDGTQLAVTVDNASSNLAIQLVNAPTATLGPRIDAQQGPFNAIIDAFQSPVVFSTDGHQVSSIASRGPWEGRGLTTTNVTKQSAIETFDTRTGARIPGPAVAVGQELVGVSSDLREIATLSSTDATHSAVTVVDARSGAQLVQIPVPGLAFTFPVVFAPNRSNMVIQPGPDVLAVTDWTQAGAPHFARATLRRISPVEVSANGTTIDLTPALHRLGLPTRCFAPLASNCNYTIDVTCPHPSHTDSVRDGQFPTTVDGDRGRRWRRRHPRRPTDRDLERHQGRHRTATHRRPCEV